MSTTVYHVDQNVIIVVDDNSQKIHNTPDRIKDRKQVQKLNKEKLKILLQISGCKASHSFQISEKIFEHIFSKLKQSFAKRKDGDDNDQTTVTNDETLQNTVVVSEKYFKEVVLNAVCEKKYMQNRRDSYLEDFKIARSLTERRAPLIILLGGTSGTGKSTVSSILASRFGISTVLSTDSIRHIIRNFLSKEENAILFASTYEAGKHLQADENLSETRRIIKGYKMQCNLVQDKLEHVVKKYNDTNDSIIIEGVHLTPFFMFQIMKKYKRVLPFALCIAKESKHKERFAVRSKYMTLDPGNNKYIENFPRIRLIQKWFLEKADEFLIPKVDNSNIDKSIEVIHKTIMNYLQRLNMEKQRLPEETSEQEFQELKNALPFYEEYNRVSKNAWSSKELKDYINTQVNKDEIYENFLQQINESQRENNMKEIDIDQMRKNTKEAPKHTAMSDVENMTQKSGVSNSKTSTVNQPAPARKTQKELLQQSVQKFNEINSKNDKVQEINPVAKTGEGNFIIEGVDFIGNEKQHLSDDEDQNRRQQFDEQSETKPLKKAKSLKNLHQADQKIEEQPVVEEQKNNGTSSPLRPPTEPLLERLEHKQEDHKDVKRVSFVHVEEIDSPPIIKAKSKDEEETTPQRIDYKGILQHLSKHKRLFLSKKTKAQNIIFIKRMIENYNANYKSKHNNDRLRFIQNNDGSYCLYKIKSTVVKTQKKNQAQKTMPEQDDDNNSSSDQGDSECLSSINPGKSMLTPGLPFSEKQISDEDSVRFLPDQDSDNEPFDGVEEAINSVEGSDSSDDEAQKDRLMQFDEEDDSFELQKIEEVEFDDEEKVQEDG